MSESLKATVRGIFSLNSDVNGPRSSFGDSKYRPNHQFPEYPSTFIGFVDFDGDECAPGESRDVVIEIVFEKNMKELLKPGNSWDVKEWPHVVGSLKIIEVEFES